MGFSLSFNATQVNPNTRPMPVPSGIYDVVIVKSEEKPVKNKPGCTYYEFEMEILGPPEFRGRKVYDRLNCKNDNQQAVDIAYGTLSAMCYVTGVMQIQQSSAELHGKPFKVNVVKIPNSNDPTQETNDVRGYLDSAGNQPGQPGQTAQASSGNGDWNNSGATGNVATPSFATQHVDATQQAQNAAANAAASVANPQTNVNVAGGKTPAELAAESLAAQQAEVARLQAEAARLKEAAEKAAAAAASTTTSTTNQVADTPATNNAVPSWAR